jgi:hypothetical protein
MLEIFVFDPAMRTEKNPHPSFHVCYNSWKEIWNEEYQKLDPNYRWSSDTFTRQEYIVAIFYDQKYAGSVLYRTLDLKSAVDRDDSFLSHWPSETVTRLAQKFGRALVCTSYTVAKDFRRAEIMGYSMKDMVCAMTLFYFKQSGYPVTLGLTRNTRKVNDTMMKAGWESLGEINFKDEPSEMVYCRAESPSKIPPELENILATAMSRNLAPKKQRTEEKAA